MSMLNQIKKCESCGDMIDMSRDAAVSLDHGVTWFHRLPCSREPSMMYLRPMLLAVRDALAICASRFPNDGPWPNHETASPGRELMVAVIAHLYVRYAELTQDYHSNSQIGAVY